jgi:Flp pilus assembly protein TadD
MVDEAVACFQQVLRLNPNHAQAYSNLGDALRVQGKPDEAEACCRRALQLMPNLADAHNNLGNALQEQGQLDEAVACYQRALELQPHFAAAHNNLCTALQEQGQLDEAVACYRRALQLHPHLAEVHNNLGTALQEQGKLDEAAACHRRALQLNPNNADAHTSLGKALADQGNVDEAHACYRRALQLNPNCAEAHLNRSLLWLLLGNYEQGWPEYEWRWRRKDLSLPRLPQPLWDGAPLPGRTLLLYAEQGSGDTLQFIRYVPLAKERAGRVVVSCPESLLSLVQSCPGIDQLVAHGTPLPPFDAHTPLLSLPRLLGTTTLHNIPARVPYLSAPAEQVARWRHELAGPLSLKVGLCWEGNPGNKRNRLRSVRLEQLAPLAQVPGVRLFSLQKGAGAEQLGAVRECWGMIDLGRRFESWADTAAAVSALDLVVTVETAMAHLAGALGKPAWVLLPMSPDWRWLLQREDSPWYPSLRLFRQRRWDDWPEVIARVAAALSA